MCFENAAKISLEPFLASRYLFYNNVWIYFKNIYFLNQKGKNFFIIKHNSTKHVIKIIFSDLMT